MVSGGSLSNAIASSSGLIVCPRPDSACRQCPSSRGAAVSSLRPLPRRHAHSRDQHRPFQSHGPPPTSNLLAGRRAFFGAAATQLMQNRQHRWQHSARLGRLPPGKPYTEQIWRRRHAQPAGSAVPETALHHSVHPSLALQRSRRCLDQQWPEELRVHTRVCSAVGVGGVAQPTTAAAAIFGGMARSLLRASPRQLFRSLSRLLIRAARPLLTGPGSVVRSTLCAIWQKTLSGGHLLTAMSVSASGTQQSMHITTHSAQLLCE